MSQVIDVEQVKKVVIDICNKYPNRKNPRIDSTNKSPVQFTEKTHRPSCIVGHVLVELFPNVAPGDLSDIWPIVAEYFDAKYEPIN